MLRYAMKLSALLLVALFSICWAEYNGIDGDRDGKLLLNPFGILGNQKCRVSSGDEGICHGEVECISLAGNYGNFCSGLQGLCCVFLRTCDMRTSQEVAYFRSKLYPQNYYDLPDCSFKVLKRSRNYCSIRLQASPDELPQYPENCQATFLHVDGAGPRSPIPLCKTLGLNYLIDVTSVEHITLRVHSITTINVRWKIKVTQISCNEDSGTGPQIVLPNQTASPIGPITTTKRPTTTRRPKTTWQPPISSRPTTTKRPVLPPSPPSPPAPPTGTNTRYSECGIKGPDGREFIRDDGLDASAREVSTTTILSSKT